MAVTLFPRTLALVGSVRLQLEAAGCWHEDEAFRVTRAGLAGLEDRPSTTVLDDLVEEQG